MLEELELEYSHVPAPPRDELVYSLNPLGRIPVLLVGEDPISDSTVILNFLADKHSKMTASSGSISRARQDALTHQIIDEFDAVLWATARHSFILPTEHRVPEIKPSLKWEFARNCDLIAERLEDQPFLMGDDLTVPDIIFTHCLDWAKAAKIEIKNETINSYADAMRAREAYKIASG